MSRPAVFLDRDGILNELTYDARTGNYESPTSLESVALKADVAHALQQLMDGGYLLVICTNQPAAAKGYISAEGLGQVHARVLSLLAANGIDIDASRLCLHHPDGVVAGLSFACNCRKPQPGMLLDAAGELDIDLPASWMIGDSDTDVQAGQAVGCRTVLIEEPKSQHRRSGSVQPDIQSDDLVKAVSRLLTFRA